MLVLENEYLIGALNAEWAFRWGGGQWAESSELHLCPGAGSMPTQRRAFTVPTLLLFYLLSNVLFHFSIPLLSPPLLHFLAHHLFLHFGCQFSLFFTFRVLWFADLRLCYLLSNSSVVNTKSGGHLSVFQKHCKKKKVSSLPDEGVKSARWDVGCVYGYDCTWLGKCSCLCVWLHVRHSSGETWGSSVTCMTSEGLRMSFKVVRE